MNVDGFSNPTLGNGAIQNLGYMINNYDLPKSIMNFFDWQNLYNDAKTFAAFNAFGQVSATMPINLEGGGNYRVYFNKPTGFLTEYETDSSFILTIAGSNTCNLAADLAGESTGKDAVHPTFTLNQITCTPASLSSADATPANLAAALDLVNIHIREGLGLYVMGGLYDESDNAITDATCAFVFTGVNGSGKLECELMDSSVALSGTPKYLGAIKGKVRILVSDFALFDGAAPTADDMGTTQYSNCLQMFDATIGKGYSEQSQSTYFDNKFEGLFPPLRTMQHVKYDTSLLFGIRGAVPADGTNRGTARGAMKGIWGMMNLHDASLNTDRAKPAVRVDAGTTIDFWKLYEFIEQRPTYVNKNMLCITTPKMGMLLKQAAEQTRDLVRVPSIEFPNVPGDVSYSFRIGDTTLHCITDKILSYHPVFKDYAGNKASQGCVMLMLDMRYCGIKYQNNTKLGPMIPQISNIDPINGERKDRAHMFSCWTTAIWNPQMHAFYGLNTAA